MNFKIFNFNRPACELDSERMESMKEYDGEYNYELENEYFENIWFHSDMDLELIEYQIYFTKHEHFRITNLYLNPKYIQDFYESKFQTPFFYALADEKSKEKYHPSHQLGKFLNFSDFKEIIKPNLKIELTQKIKNSQLREEEFHLLNNWDFYTELQISTDSNSLLRFIDTIPYGTKKSYKNRDDAKIAGIKILFENAHSTVDTQLKGLILHVDGSNSRLFTISDFFGKKWMSPKIRNLNWNYNIEIMIEKEILLDDIDSWLKLFEKNGLIPFKIEDRR